MNFLRHRMLARPRFYVITINMCVCVQACRNIDTFLNKFLQAEDVNVLSLLIYLFKSISWTADSRVRRWRRKKWKAETAITAITINFNFFPFCSLFIVALSILSIYCGMSISLSFLLIQYNQCTHSILYVCVDWRRKCIFVWVNRELWALLVQGWFGEVKESFAKKNCFVGFFLLLSTFFLLFWLSQ